jgi:hypothetical protein
MGSEASVRSASHRPDDKAVLDPENPKKALDYFYQIRSNITHRGKAVVQDHDRLLNSLEELLQIFRNVLATAFQTPVPGAD